MKNLEAFAKPFEPSQIENRLRGFWEENKFYKASRDPKRKPYTIVIPPPNVTGDLHMGHMLNNTLQDVLIRWHRGLGDVSCWIPGTDHASIATEAKVTAALAKEGISKKAIGREEFLKHAWKWADTYRQRIVGLLKALGISCDWDREQFTMGEDYSKSVIKAFVKLYKDGLIYRGQRLVNWCPASQSVISDEEVLNQERDSHMWHIRYPIVGEPGKFMVVATTRPETLLGDLALAVSPSDERYTQLVGKKVVVPVCNREIPIIADHYVEKEFGTGVVKITPAHDPNDFQVGERHKLGLLNIMHPDASLNDNAPEAYRGLDRFAARKKLVAELESLGLMEKIEPYKHTVGISERGNVPIEYYLSEQWYLNMKPMAELALKATRTGKLTLVPAHMEKIWEHWLVNIKDWCLSRQLWWGHRIPVYTCVACGHVMCEEEAPKHCEKCKGDKLEQDTDVLDTWASSWLWPFAVHNWANPTAEQKADLDYFYPTDIIVTGPDIIFFWIARMVMAGEYFMGKTPFHHVYFTGIVRDSIGRKMSKSLGNGTDIFGVIDKYGTDAMRFSLVNQIVTGADIDWADESCEIGRHFANKIWNCTRFLLMNCDKLGVNAADCSYESLSKALAEAGEDPLTRWITAEFAATIDQCHQSVNGYEFSGYSGGIYEFIWMVYCDWFVELAKPRFGQEDAIAKSTLRVALSIFDGLLRLLHPLMPYVTEEIWQNVYHGGSEPFTVGHKLLPRTGEVPGNAESVARMRDVQAVVGVVRTIRGQYTIHPGTELSAVVRASAAHFGNLLPMMEFLAKARFTFQGEKPKLAATAMAAGMEVLVNLEGLVDVAAEKARLEKRIQKVEQAIAGTEKRLANAEFVKSAPAHIVEGAQAQLDANRKELAMLKESLATLGA